MAELAAQIGTVVTALLALHALSQESFRRLVAPLRWYMAVLAAWILSGCVAAWADDQIREATLNVFVACTIAHLVVAYRSRTAVLMALLRMEKSLGSNAYKVLTANLDDALLSIERPEWLSEELLKTSAKSHRELNSALQDLTPGQSMTLLRSRDGTEVSIVRGEIRAVHSTDAVDDLKELLPGS